MTNVVSIPIKPTPIQEMCQQLTEINPQWAFVLMYDDKNGYSFMLPPEVEVSSIYYGLSIGLDSLLEMAYEE